MHGFAAKDNVHRNAVAVWDVLLRGSGIGLLALLALAYFTGEEFHQTHMLIGYAIAAVILTNLYWELVRPHPLHLPGAHAPQVTFVTVLRGAFAPDTPAFAAIGVLGITAVLAAATLALMTATHNLWPAVDIDEIHEAVAYFALGLVALHIAVVLIASSDHLERRLARLFGRR
jgi:cytochrome b